MKKILLLPVLSLLLYGCYTQLLSTSNVSEGAADGSQSGYVTSSPECDCTPYEIQRGLCWCRCDRCGYFHRLGYIYCPTGFYRSYWGWDYYTEYPWWYNRYYSRYRQPTHYYSGSGGSGYVAPADTTPDTAPFIGNRRNHRSLLAPVESAPRQTAPKSSATQANTSPSQTPVIQKSPAENGKTDSAGTSFEEKHRKKRAR